MYEESQREASRRRPQSHYEDEGAYQVDLITALFSVFLILLIVSAPQIARMVGNPGLMDYQTKDPPARTFQLETFAAVYPFRRLWAIKDGLIGEIKFDEIARRYQAKGVLDYEDTIEGVDIRLTTIQHDIDGFRLEITIFGKGLPNWIAENIRPTSEIDQVAGEMLSGTASSLIFVWADRANTDAGTRLARTLAEKGKPHKLVYLEPGFSTIEVHRSAAIFDSELVLRSY